MNAAHATERQNITHTQWRSLLQGMCEGIAVNGQQLSPGLSSLCHQITHLGRENFAAFLTMQYTSSNFDSIGEIIFLIEYLSYQFDPSMAFCWLQIWNVFQNFLTFDSLEARNIFYFKFGLNKEDFNDLITFLLQFKYYAVCQKFCTEELLLITQVDKPFDLKSAISLFHLKKFLWL